MVRNTTLSSWTCLEECERADFEAGYPLCGLVEPIGDGFLSCGSCGAAPYTIDQDEGEQCDGERPGFPGDGITRNIPLPNCEDHVEYSEMVGPVGCTDNCVYDFSRCVPHCCAGMDRDDPRSCTNAIDHDTEDCDGTVFRRDEERDCQFHDDALRGEVTCDIGCKIDLRGCEECGGYHDPCCDGTTCSQDLNRLTCSWYGSPSDPVENVCVPCGGTGGQCCTEGAACTSDSDVCCDESNNFCNHDMIERFGVEWTDCKACGNSDSTGFYGLSPCCEVGPPCRLDVAVVESGIGACGPDGLCPCGVLGASCCYPDGAGRYDGECEEGAACAPSVGICVRDN